MAPWLLLLLLFPLICALIGYVTNVVAVKMIFRPHQRVRFAGVSFQGVLPKHQHHFASMLGAIIARDFLSTGDLVDALQSPEAAERFEALLRELAPAVVDEVRRSVPEGRRAMLNDQMVAMAVDQIVAEANKRLPGLIASLRERAGEAVDLEDIVTDKVMSLGPGGLERIIYAVSKRELDFIEYYGAIFGFALGLLQWGVLQLVGNIALPIVGAVVGTVTNWLAIQMLFYPREPTKYLGFFEYQGMFPKRQFEMAQKMGAIAAEELIVPGEVFGEIADALVPEQLTATQLAEVEAPLREEVPPLFQLVDALVPEAERPTLRERLASALTGLLPRMRHALVSTASEIVDIDAVLTGRLRNLEKAEFETLLRGLFEREEIYLIIYGGLLGGLIGTMQLLLVGWVG